MQKLDLELERWQRQWRAQQAVPPDLVKSVEAGTRNMRRGVIAEILVTVVMGGGSLAWALAARRTDVTVLAFAVWILIAVAWTASLLLRRGAWQPVTATTAAFVDISILRCEARSATPLWPSVARSAMKTPAQSSFLLMPTPASFISSRSTRAFKSSTR